MASKFFFLEINFEKNKVLILVLLVFSALQEHAVRVLQVVEKVVARIDDLEKVLILDLLKLK